MPSSRPWLRLADIAENAQRIVVYTKDMNYEAFVANHLVSDAAERCLARISEAATKLGQTAEELLPGHDWQAIRGIGNVLRHDYDRIALPRIWEAIEKNIRPLLEDVEAAVEAHYPSET